MFCWPPAKQRCEGSQRHFSSLPIAFTPKSAGTHLGALAAAAVKCCAGGIEGQLGVGTEVRRDPEGGGCLRFRKADGDIEDVVVGRPCRDKLRGMTGCIQIAQGITASVEILLKCVS